MSEAEHIDVIVIGAGVAGLGAAKSYVQVDPAVDLVILERNTSLGGVWATEKLYKGLKTNDFLGSYEFPDFPLNDDRVKDGQHIPGYVLHEYLEAYAKQFNIYDRIRLGAVVSTITRVDDGWLISMLNGSSIHCNKLMVATGMTSEPFIPKLPGSERFDAPILHSADLAKRGPKLLETTKRVVVLGSQKSAYDAVYMFATAGIQVDWIIRESGHGPGWLLETKVNGVEIRVDKLVFVRAANWFSPCIWQDDGKAREFLHRTAIGRWLVDRVWKFSAWTMTNAAGWTKHPSTKNLQPWSNPFWWATSISAFNYPTDFMELIRSGMVNVRVADIKTLSPNKTIELSTGESLNTDALIAATGWSHIPSLKFLPEGIERDLGIPYRTNEPDTLAAEADAEILRRFPRLVDQPVLNEKLKKLSDDDEVLRPFRLYRLIAPPTDKFNRSITFQGMLHAPSHCLVSEIQGLWAVAYLTGRLELPSEAERIREAVLVNRWLALRYPAGYGTRLPDYAFDTVPRFDQLLTDMGLNTQRKPGLVAHLFSPHYPPDYKGLVEEWKAKEVLLEAGAK